MEEWSWFHGKKQVSKNQQYANDINWHKVANNKNQIQDLVLKDPSILFKVVDSESSCMCGGTCDHCEYDDITFFGSDNKN